MLTARCTFCFMLGKEKQVATVFWQLMVTHQSDAHLEVLLSVSCIVKVTVAVDSEAFHIVKSSAWRDLKTCREKLVVMSFMKATKRVGEINPPCGTPSLPLRVWLELLSTLTQAALWHRKLLI